MNMMIKIVGAIIGLFVDDELLAIGILCVVGLTALLLDVFGMEPLAAGAGLLCGNILVLGVGAIRTARRLASV
jgi:hypothetical protein